MTDVIAPGAQTGQQTHSTHPEFVTGTPADWSEEPADDVADVTPIGPRVETRRERLRRETIEEIKAAARQHLTLEATSQLSLRAVARDVGLTPSAIYRYFQSQQELMAAVADDAYSSASAALRESAEHTRGLPTHERLRRLGHAYRQWARDHKAEFNLIFSTDQTDPTGGAATVSTEVLEQFFAVPVSIYVDAVATGEVVASRSALPRSPRLRPAAERFAAKQGVALTPEAINMLLCGWGAFHGFVMLELFGHLGRFYLDPDEAFDQHLGAVLATMGMHPR